VPRPGGQLAITAALTSHGPGADRLAVSGNDASRVFGIGTGVTVAIDDLAITHGRADSGGGVRNAGGNLTLAHVVVSQNEARGVAGVVAGTRGGVFHDGGTLTIQFSMFQDNRAVGGAGAPGQIGSTGAGGAVYSASGVVDISHSAFTGNEAVGGAGGSGARGSFGRGGAIMNAG